MTKYMRQFYILTLLGFILFIGFIGFFLLVLDMPKAGYVLQIASAWTPSFVFLGMFKKIYPNTSILAYIKKQFTGKIRLSDFMAAVLFFPFIWFGTAWIVCILQNQDITAILVSNPGVMFISFFTCLIRGPLGEELGWRAFLLNELEKKYGFLKAVLINGSLWGFWHFPLILVEGYTAAEMLIQFTCNMVALIALTLIMALLYKQSKNLLVAILLHQFFNYARSLIAADSIASNIAITICTCIIAIIYWLLYARTRAYKVPSRLWTVICPLPGGITMFPYCW